MRIEHGITATINAPVDEVWALLGRFDDLSWNTLVTDVRLLDDEAGDQANDDETGATAVREMHSFDGATVRERLLSSGPGRSFAYSFDGPPPLPVTSSRATVTAAAASTGTADAPDTSDATGTSAATVVSWSGAYDVTDDQQRDLVEHLNCDVVWPAMIAALASALHADHHLNSPKPDTTARVRAVADAYVEAWRIKDAARFHALLAADVAFSAPTVEVTGADACTAGFTEMTQLVSSVGGQHIWADGRDALVWFVAHRTDGSTTPAATWLRSSTTELPTSGSASTCCRYDRPDTIRSVKTPTAALSASDPANPPPPRRAIHANSKGPPS